MSAKVLIVGAGPSEMEDIGFEKNAAYLIRPDGYISWTSKNQEVASLKEYLSRWR